MPRLRKLIARLFWVVPFVYALPAVSVPFLVFSLIQGVTGGVYQDGGFGARQVATAWVARLLLFLLAISPGTICITSIITAVQFIRGKQNGRIWAIVCGIAFLACSIPAFAAYAMAVNYSGSSSGVWLAMPVLGVMQVVAGVLILVAFLPRESVSQPLFQNDAAAKIKGDGTTSLSLYAAAAVLAGGFLLGDSLCRRWSTRANLPSDSNFLHSNLILFGALILATAFHELGHIAAGQTVGMKILSFRIGPLHAALEEGKWRLVPPTSWKCVLAGGVTMIPRNPLRYSRRQQVGGAAGGVLANLCVGALALLGMLTAKGSAYEPAWYFLGQTATISLAFVAVNLIPAREAAAYSDGARIYQILTDSVVENYRRILALPQAMAVTPLRPRDFDIELIERVAATDTPGFDHVFLLLIASDCYFDRGQMESARHKVREAEALCDQQTSFWAESCGAMVLRATCILADRDMAEKWWQRSLAAKSFSPGKKNQFPACAYFAISGRLSEAEEAWRAELEHASRLPESGERAFDLYYLGRLREMLDEAAMRTASASSVRPGNQLQPLFKGDSVQTRQGSGFPSKC